jgi:signal transduction histidine kinase
MGPSSARYNTGYHHQAPHDIALLTEEVLDTALWSTPKPTPLSDKDARRASIYNGSSTSPIKVILEVEQGDDFNFKVNSGAWRRIVQNLVTNSLKYTDTGGYLKLSLAIRSPDEETTDKGKTLVELTCMDSGRGMSQQVS